jgi:hypothetical protein
MQTASFAVVFTSPGNPANSKLLGLYLAVLIERSQGLTTLEMVMSFWALGYMLDEVLQSCIGADCLGGWLFQCRDDTIHPQFMESMRCKSISLVILMVRWGFWHYSFRSWDSDYMASFLEIQLNQSPIQHTTYLRQMQSSYSRDSLLPLVFGPAILLT